MQRHRKFHSRQLLNPTILFPTTVVRISSHDSVFIYVFIRTVLAPESFIVCDYSSRLYDICADIGRQTLEMK